MRQLKRFKYLPKSKLETIYFSSIVPSISYCSLVWGTSTPPLMNDLEHIHARAAKPSTDCHGTYQIKMPKKVLDGSHYQTNIKRSFKVNRDITPDKIANLFSIANQHYNLRNSNPFVLPRYNLDIGRRPLAWQLTPTSLKHSHSLKNFKNLLKERRHKNFINGLNFLKETCMVSQKNQDFKYF